MTGSKSYIRIGMHNIKYKEQCQGVEIRYDWRTDRICFDYPHFVF